MVIISTLTPTIPEASISSHYASCIMSVQEGSAQIMPEKASVMNETVEKRIALPIISGVPGYIPSMIIGASYHMLWSLFL